MAFIFIASSLLLLCAAAATISAFSTSEELFRIQLYPGHDLVLRAQSNPCTELVQYCETLNRTSLLQRCLQDYQHKMQSEILVFSNLMKRLDIDERLFHSCSDIVPAYPETERGDYFAEMLQILRSGPPGDADTLARFEVRVNEVRMEESEALEIHKHAVLLHPNSTFALSRYGLVLQNFGHSSLAYSLWENTVQRGLWPSVLQRPERYHVPQADPKPWYDPADYPFAAKLEAGFAAIRRELLYNLEQNRQSVLTEDLMNRVAVLDNHWRVIHIKNPSNETQNSNYTAESEYFPETVSVLENCGIDFILAKFSAIVPGTHIRPHTGPSNDRLRVHLGLVHTGGARIRVGNEWRAWEEGKVMIFDSSWEHEVYHDGPDLRVVLIADIWLRDL